MSAVVTRVVAKQAVAWAAKTLDKICRRLAAGLRQAGRADGATTIKHTRWALLNNPPNLTGN